MRQLLALLLIGSSLAGCGEYFDGGGDQRNAADLALWREIGRRAAEFRLEHPGQPLPDYLGPPPPLGATDCITTLDFGDQLYTSCNSY